MSVIQIITKARGTSGSADSNGRFRYGITLQVVTNDPADEAQTIGAALGFSPFDMYSFGNGFDPLARAKQIDIRRSTNDPFVWDVEVEFDTEVEDWPENPLERPTVIDYGFVQFEQPYWLDANAQAVTNSAGVYFDPPLTRDQSRLEITMTKNELVFPLSLAVSYQDAVNSDPWFGFLPNQVKVTNISGKFTKENGYSFYENVYQFQCRRDTWYEQVQNMGYIQQNGKPCTEQDGETPVTEPVPLDASGNQLPWPINTTNITYKTVQPYPSLPFAELSVP